MRTPSIIVATLSLSPGSTSVGNLFYSGFYVEALCFLTPGDHRPVDRVIPGYERIRPMRNFVWRRNGGYSGTGVGVNLNKVFGPHGDYAYTKVDWPKPVFTADKRLQIVLPGGQSFVLPLTSLAK